MPLACALARHPAELTADMRQYYGIDIRDCNNLDYAWTLVCQLPSDSRFYVAENPDCAWTLEAVLDALLINDIRLFMWALAGGKNSEKPKRIGPSWMRLEDNAESAMVLPIDELDKRLKEFDEQFNKCGEVVEDGKH